VTFRVSLYSSSAIMLRDHGVEASAHFAVCLVFDGKFVADDNAIVASAIAPELDAEFVQASVGQILQVRL